MHFSTINVLIRFDWRRQADRARGSPVPGAAGAARQGVRPGGAAAAPGPGPRAAGRRGRGPLAVRRSQL